MSTAPPYLELRQRDEQTYDVLWRVPATGNLRLGVHVKFPHGTLVWTEPRGTFASGVLTERWTISRPGGLAGGEVVITGLPAGITDVLARVERLDGTTQVERLVPSRPRFVIEAPLTGAGVSRTYLVLGIHHILEGVDHLLFVAALVLVVGNLRRLLVTITAFTLAHSVTLAAATLGLVRVPQAPVEAVIALSIVFVAAEIVRGLEAKAGLTARAPWVVAFAFGLLHGFGFAGALAEVGLPPRAHPSGPGLLQRRRRAGPTAVRRGSLGRVDGRGSIPPAQAAVGAGVARLRHWQHRDVLGHRTHAGACPVRLRRIRNDRPSYRSPSCARCCRHWSSPSVPAARHRRLRATT